ncbi:MAG: EAL domain-containing protein [Novosphingobium sp.]
MAQSEPDAVSNAGRHATGDAARPVPVRVRKAGAVAARAGEPADGLFSAFAATHAADALLSRRWNCMAGVFAGSAAFAAIFAGIPPVRSIFLIAAASLLVLAGIYFVRLGNRVADAPWQRAMFAVPAVAVPMAVFGLGMGYWNFRAGEFLEGPLAAFILASVIATLIQSGKRYTLFTVQIAGWSGLLAWFHSPSAVATLLVLVPIAVLVDRMQAAAQRASLLRREAELRLSRRAEDILHDFEESGQGWFWETDSKGMLAYLSPATARLFNMSRGDMIGCHLSKLFETGSDSHDGERTLAFHLSARSAFHELAVRAPLRGEERWWSVTGKPIYDSYGNYVGFRGSAHDLTEKRRTQEEATRLARYDSLTGLANRFQISKTLERLLDAPREAQRTCAVFLLDLDRFKQVNDTLGHPAGDALLTQVSQRLLRVVAERGRVGRLGGDEFQVILGGAQVRDDLANLAHRIIESLSQPYSIEGHRVIIGASVGIALAPEDGTTSDALVRNADLALYAAKDAGRGCYRFYATDLHSRAEEKRQLEQDLRDAIHAGALELHYQPVIETATEEISGFEALMRWNHPTRGMLSPARFVEVAEDTGLIAAMGEWAIRTACHDLARWPESVRVAVNVSPIQFANPQLPGIVTSAIAQAGIDPQRLELEITESVFLADDSNTDAMFASLKRIGVRLALDDFGTGYSSLSYLKKAPFDKIKIDQGFVRGATMPGSRNGAIIASITSLTQSLGMDTTAEGVETLDELELVRLLGCSHVQGYVYDKPFDADEATRRLESGLKAVASGPRASRGPRQTMLRKVVLDHEGEIYTGTIRNISANGAMIEGLWNVPPETTFKIAVSDDLILAGKARWSQENRMGIEFQIPVDIGADGRISLKRGVSQEEGKPRLWRQAG